MGSVKFILGRSGSGKTDSCYTAIKEGLKKDPFNPHLMLVPEQFNLEVQKQLARELYPGLLSVEVISFNTLAREVFREIGKTESAVIEDLERMIILKKIIEENKKEIVFYKKNINNTGFIESMNRFITLLEQSGIGIGELEEFWEDEKSSLLFKSKLEDLKLIYGEFENYLGKEFVTIEKNMTLLAKGIASSKKLEEARIWIDGFYGFTHQQILILQELMKKAKEVIVTLPMDRNYSLTEKVRINNPFYESIINFHKLLRACEDSKLKYSVDIVNYMSETKTSELKYLEKNYLSSYANKYEEENNSIYLNTYSSRSIEVEHMAQEIVKLVRQEEYRYNEIAVLVGSLGDYDNLIESIFKSYDIPYFLDVKRNIHTNSFVAFIESTLEILTSSYSYKSVMKFLRCEILSIPRTDIDRLENYILAYGIKGKKKWNEEWSYDEKNREVEKEINITRLTILEPIQRLEIGLKETRTKGKNTVLDITRALYMFLEDVKAHDKLNEYVDKYKKDNNRLLEIETTQIWDKIIEVFERLALILEMEQMDMTTYRRILETSFSYIKVGIIPPTQDQVLIGEIERTRVPQTKACFVLGSNEGAIPKVEDKTPVFSEMDKMTLSSLCYKQEGAKGRLYDLVVWQPIYGAQFSMYTVLTKATNKLYMSVPIADENGVSMRTSMIYYKLKRIFGEKEVNEDKFLRKVQRPVQTFEYMSSMLSDYIEGRIEGEDWKDLVSWYMLEGDWKGKLEKLMLNLFYTNQQHYLNEDTTKKLYGNRLDTSISKLESFRQCACCYFMKYGIKASERRTLKFDSAKIGTLFHSALEQYPKELTIMNTTWKEASKQQMMEGVRLATKHAVNEVNKRQRETGSFQFTARKVEKMTSRAINALTEHLRNGEFEPKGYEVNFGSGDGFPPIEIEIDKERMIYVVGQIDRIDVFYKSEKEQYVKILDYKSGQKNFDLLEVYYGLQLQLLLYLDAYLKKENTYEPAGVFYFHINNPYTNYTVGMNEDEIQASNLKQFKLSGLAVDIEEVLKALDKTNSGTTIPVAFNKDGSIKKGSSVATIEQFSILEKHIVDTIRDLGKELLDGKVSAKPYRLKGKNPCDYCGYHNICQFGEDKRDNCYDELQVMKKEQVWKALEEEEN